MSVLQNPVLATLSYVLQCVKATVSEPHSSGSSKKINNCTNTLGTQAKDPLHDTPGHNIQYCTEV